MVSFHSDLRATLEFVRTKGSSVALVNCQVKGASGSSSRVGREVEIMAKSLSKMEASPLFAQNAKTCFDWKIFCGMSVPSYSLTRWWNKWEVKKVVIVQFELFLRSQDDLSPATHRNSAWHCH